MIKREREEKNKYQITKLLEGENHFYYNGPGMNEKIRSVDKFLALGSSLRKLRGVCMCVCVHLPRECL